MPQERIAIQLRLRLTAKRAVDELVAYTGASREEVLNTLIIAGLPAMYALYGIERDPAVMTAGLLDAMAGPWADAMSDEELAAVKTTREALDRIAQVRVREG